MADTSYERPTLAAILSRIMADIRTRVDGVEPTLRRSLSGALAHALSGAAHTLHGLGAWITRQALVSTADETYVESHGAIYGIVRTAATPASGPVTFTGTEGTTIPAGTVWQRADGWRYETDAEAILPHAGTIDVECTAQTEGLDSDCDAGVEGTLISPIAGVASTVTVATGGMVDGYDEEDLEDYRARIVARIQYPPHGGSVADYEAWAQEVAGIDRVWVYPSGLGAGTVLVYVTVEGEGEDIIPSAEKIAEVQAHIDAVAPVDADVYVYAPTAHTVDITIDLTPDDATTKAAVVAELEALFADADLMDIAGTVYLSWIGEAISRAAGEEHHSVSIPSHDVVCTAGEIPVLGTVTWA